MRAIYHPFEKISAGSLLQIAGDAAHHLNVVRVRQKEDILILNGNGTKLTGTVESITKNLVEVSVTKTETFEPNHELSLAIALPKKDAFEDILKMATELGIRNIYPLSSEFSQYEYAPGERVQRLLESALIQSNNAYFPVIHTQDTLKNFLSKHQGAIAFFNSKKNDVPERDRNVSKMTILIGPEGGFSPMEIEMISAFSDTLEIHLPTPILRAPTAVATSVGYLLRRS